MVIGSDNYKYSSDSFIGGQVISIARASAARVLIVPAHYEYQPVQQALVRCDFDALASLSKIDSYTTTSPKWKEKKLLVLNVDPKQPYLHPDETFANTETALHQYLKTIHYELFYSDNKSVINGILHFSKVNDVQMIIALPGKYSFLYSFHYSSVLEALYRNATKPVLIFK